ncbi:transcriptional regulator [Paenibacillus castaneae]|uniref:FMN-binding negative transcriptional regulator n=1 Tax=Paenibacillus castaneae TaxID=474957 RepID=UPI000C9AB9B2|nr:FMN-binding negative transcriptional regulator [Paenibacillus castaneae]NIK75699.1 transcriptional regulator [Paenibacillus castaneae]
MYIPNHFKMDDQAEIYKFIEENSFAIVFSNHEGRPFATHLPLVLDRLEGCLYGHFAKPNPQWVDIESQEVLAIFKGPHSYISPSWYESDTAVPTWNYIAVHAYGMMEIIKDSDVLYSTLKEMVQKYELPDSTYRLDEVDHAFIEGMSKGIVGFKIKIASLEGKWKLSQNHSEERRKLVIQQLEISQKQDAQELADRMKRYMRS